MRMVEPFLRQQQVALGLEIRARRELLSYSQEAFASEVGVHRTYLGAIERGERNPSLKNLLKIATALGCPLSVILNAAEGRVGKALE